LALKRHTIGLPPPTHRSERVALVILDVVSTYAFDGGARLLRAMKACAPNIVAVAERARRASVPVIYVNDGVGHWKSDFPDVFSTCCQHSPKVRALLQPLRPADGDYVILKPRHSAFYGTPLEALLENLRVSTLMICGVSAESCVLATVCDAHTHGFRMIVPGDSIAGVDPRAVRRTLQAIDDAFRARVPARAASVRFRRGGLLAGGAGHGA
jgi:nicotinamidase-related amidase